MRPAQKIFLSIVVIAFVFSCIGLAYAHHVQVARMSAETSSPNAQASMPSYAHAMDIGDVSLQVAYAKTEAEREQGLSDTPSLGAEQGMLFFYDPPVIPLFWMKDMRYDLDMIWIQDGKVADISPDAKVSDFPKTYSPTVPISYVLEVNAGFAAVHGIAIGTPVTVGE